MTNCHAALGYGGFESRGLSCNSDPEAHEAAYAPDSRAKNTPPPPPPGTGWWRRAPPLRWSVAHLAVTSVSSAGSIGHEGREFLLWRNAEPGLSAAAASCSVVTDPRARGARCLQRLFNILPAPPWSYQGAGGGEGAAEAAARPGDYPWPHGGGL